MSKSENKQILISCKKEFIYKFITSIAIVILLLIIPILYSKAIDYISYNAFKKAIVILIIFGVITLIYRFFEIINQKAYYKLYSKLYYNYMNLGLVKTCNNSLYSLSRFSLSEYSNILTEDFEYLSDYYSTLIIRGVEILQFIYIIIYFFFINKTIGLITLISSIGVIILLLYYNKYIVKTNELRKDYNDERVSILQEVFLSIKEIKGFNMLKKIKKNIDDVINNYILWNNKLNIDKYNIRQIALLIVDVFKVICLIYCVYLINGSYITIGVITIVYSYYTKLSDLFASIILLNENISNVRVANRRIFKLFQYAQDNPNNLENNNDISGHITFDDVLYGSRNNPTLNHVSFDIKPNTYNVLTGDERACHGIFELLLSYNRKHSGNIYIDDVEIEKYSKEDISNNINFIMLPIIFFNKSIKDNLLLFDSNFDNIVSVCKYLDIHDEILKYKDGYSTILNHNASNISNDLKYMLSFAKIFLKKSKIILIDDFLPYLTKKRKEQVINILNDLKKEHTILFITKNKSIIDNKEVDNILFINKASFVMLEPCVLMKKNCPLFLEFYKNI